MKKALIKILKWSLLFAYLIVMLSFATRKSENTISVSKIIEIDEPHKFVNEESVNNLLITNDINIDSVRLDKINFDEIERVLESDPYINSAEVYCDFAGNISITIKQRKPVMRIITNNNEHYYIDDRCSLMPISKNYSAPVITASGNISYSFISVTETNDINSIDKTYPYTLRELYNFVIYLNEHELWQYQIEQIYINEIKDIELVPRVGNHIIVLGDLKDYKFKMGKLEALYKKGFALTDWNIYSSINLKYSNQVICKKR